MNNLQGLIGLSLDMELTTVRLSLATLSSTLHFDPDIQSAIEQLATKVEGCLNTYESAVAKEGRAIVDQKERIVAAKSPHEANVDDMQATLGTMSQKLRVIRDDTLAMETDVHANIESCRKRQGEHANTIEIDQINLKKIESEIKGIDEQIATYEKDIESMDHDAKKLKKRAKVLDCARREGEKKGAFGLFTGLIGAFAAPVTGGLSLGLSMACSVYAGVNLNDADKCREKYNDLRERANDKREEADGLRNNASAFRERKYALDQEIADLQTKKEQLKKAIESLQRMTTSLLTFVKDIDQGLNVLQNMDTVFTEVRLHSQSFTIMQNAFKKNKERIEEKAQSILRDLQEKWILVERLLIANSPAVSVEGATNF